MLGERHERGDSLLAEVGKELVELHGEELLMRHGVEEAVEAVDDDEAEALFVYLLADAGRRTRREESSAGSICWIFKGAVGKEMGGGPCRGRGRGGR